MQAGEQFWWTKKTGVKYWVEVITQSYWPPRRQLLPAEVAVERPVIVRVQAGVHRGMYAVVDESDLSPFDG